MDVQCCSRIVYLIMVYVLYVYNTFLPYITPRWDLLMLASLQFIATYKKTPFVMRIGRPQTSNRI
jgi:hypothetical protein